jgi:hypothetical protein
VRDGPGSWVRNANWDQYLLRAGNLSAERIRIARVVLYDSLGKPVQPSAAPKTLNRASREASRRYREAGIEITAGAGSQALMLAGATVAAGGAELGIAVLAGAASPAAAGVAIGAMALAPVLLVGGAVESYQEERVAREMITRHTPLPYDIEPATQQNITWFFPLSPSPQRLDVTYVDPTGERTLSLNVGDMLKGLHLGDMHGPIDGRESAR